MKKISKNNECTAVPGKRKFYEFLIKCDKSLTVIEKSAAENEEPPAKRKAAGCLLDTLVPGMSVTQIIAPEDAELFRSKVDGCSYLRATHCRVRVVLDDKTEDYDCRCVQCPDPEKKYDAPLARLAFSSVTGQEESDSRCRELLETILAAVWDYDMVNDTLTYTPVSAQSEVFRLPGSAFLDLLENNRILHPDFSGQLRKLRYAFSTGFENFNFEMKLLDLSGDYRWYSIEGTMVRNEKGTVTRYCGYLRNIDKRGEMITKTDEDALTGLLNRHAMESAAGISLSSERVKSSALVLLDIDDFNMLTHLMGRHFGDALLVEVGTLLQKNTAPTDLICRVSKDIFAVLLINPKSMEEVEAKIRVINHALGHCYLNMDRSESATCCIGMAYDESGELDYEMLYYRADTALSYAKHKGKAHIEAFSEGLDIVLSEKMKDKSPNASTEVSMQNDSAESASDDLVSQSVDLLFESRELSSSINMVLSMIGHKYDAQSAEIREFTDDYQNVYVTYNWSPDYRTSVFPQRGTIAEVEETILLAGDADYYICDDVNMLEAEHPALVKFCRDRGEKGFLQIPIRDGLRISGLISYGFANSAVLHRREAVREIVLISKIIAGSITRLQTKLDIDRLNSIDNLTGCFRLGRFITEAKQLIKNYPARDYVIVYADIDRFKVINDTFGYLIGDKVLIEFSSIISDMLCEGEVLGRIEADKFVILLDATDMKRFKDRLEECDDKVNSIDVFNSTTYKVPLRCGICKVTEHDNITSVIDKANLARKSLKNTHISTYTFFDENMKSRIIKQKEIENVMFDALRNNEFVVYLQPKFSLEVNEIIGAEALVRWHRPGYGVLRPDEFIPIFEDNHFIVELDFYVLESVCTKLRNDIDRGLPTFPISVNFSRVHLSTDNFIKRLKNCIDSYGLPEHLIEVEITESALVGNEDYLVDVMASLHDIGLVVSMDDFGSGYSTLNMLKKFPVDVLKLDKEFFAESGESERERKIIANVVNLAKDLDMRVVSEGVETLEQAEFLRGVNCDIAQGYYYARPMGIDDYETAYQMAGRRTDEE